MVDCLFQMEEQEDALKTLEEIVDSMEKEITTNKVSFRFVSYSFDCL